jgi:hypothetical protein
MSADLIQQYEYLWKQTDRNWVILKAPDLLGGYCVFNKHGSVLLIENAQINEAVCKKMKEAGCEILDNIPSLGATVATVTPSNRP